MARLLAAACLCLHVVVVAMTGISALAMTAPMLTLSALCAWCAGRLRRGLAERLTMVFAGLAMVGLHAMAVHWHPDPVVALLMDAAVVLAAGQVLVVLASEVVRWARTFTGRR